MTAVFESSPQPHAAPSPDRTARIAAEIIQMVQDDRGEGVCVNFAGNTSWASEVLDEMGYNVPAAQSDGRFTGVAARAWDALSVVEVPDCFGSLGRLSIIGGAAAVQAAKYVYGTDHTGAPRMQRPTRSISARYGIAVAHTAGDTLPQRYGVAVDIVAPRLRVSDKLTVGVMGNLQRGKSQMNDRVQAMGDHLLAEPDDIPRAIQRISIGIGPLALIADTTRWQEGASFGMRYAARQDGKLLRVRR